MTTIIKLNSLEFTNFKGFNRKYNFKPGRNIFVGDNETGKTTLSDGVPWILTGKDSSNKTGFEIKPIVKGDQLHKVDYEIAGSFEVEQDDQKFNKSIKRTYKEVYASKRGKPSEDPTSHTTVYSVDDDPDVKPNDFSAVVANVFKGDIYRLVSDPKYFSSLPTQKRRDILTEIAQLTEAEVNQIIESVKGLKPKLGKKPIDQAKKIHKKRQKEIDDSNQLITVPAQLKTLKEQIDSSSEGFDKLTLERAVKEAEQAVERAQKEINKHSQGDSGINSKLKELNQKLTVVTGEFYQEKGTADRNEKARQQDIKYLEGEIPKIEKAIEENKKLTADLLNKFYAVRDEQQVVDTICFNCGSEMPPDKIDEQKGKFNEVKSKNLEEIQKRGQSIDKTVAELKKRLEEKKVELEQIKSFEVPKIIFLESSEAMRTIQAEINVLMSQKEQVETPVELTYNLDMAKNELKRAQNSLSNFEAVEHLKIQYDNLTDAHKKLTTEYNQISEFFVLCDEYDRKLAEETEKKVNGMFEITTFRMFRKQMNGELEFRCDILGPKGDDYFTNVNDGTKIKIGLDIIRVLQKHYNLYVPIFIDNAESVSRIPEMNCQVIELYKCAWEPELSEAYAVDWFGNYISENTWKSLEGSQQALCSVLS